MLQEKNLLEEMVILLEGFRIVPNVLNAVSFLFLRNSRRNRVLMARFFRFPKMIEQILSISANDNRTQKNV